MRKLMGIVVVLGIAAAAVWAFTVGPASQTGRVCSKLETICGEAVMPAEGCRADLDDATDAELDMLEACVEPADSCLEVTGCLVGSAARDLAKGAARGLLR
jgi:hypothetical protein